jgi:undecaprenyl diphosphate synthase
MDAAARSAEGAAALARIRAFNPDATPDTILPDVPVERIPRHVAIIMDGNGRWARARGMPRAFGHRAGAGVVREVVTECGRLGVEVLTLYSFSLENWKRPREEIEALMRLAVLYFEGEREELVRHGVRVRVIGQREGLPEDVLSAMDALVRATERCGRLTLCLAINYGSRCEIAYAARELAQDVLKGSIRPEEIDEAAFAQRLWTSGIPDPDLLIRTAGEMRVSNYLLWQISYAEIFVTPALWPEFGPSGLHQAIRAYASRARRFGALA